MPTGREVPIKRVRVYYDNDEIITCIVLLDDGNPSKVALLEGTTSNKYKYTEFSHENEEDLLVLFHKLRSEGNYVLVDPMYFDTIS